MFTHVKGKDDRCGQQMRKACTDKIANVTQQPYYNKHNTYCLARFKAVILYELGRVDDHPS